MRAVPEVGASKVDKIRKSVVLPLPLGPSRPNISPSRTDNVTSDNAARGPKFRPNAWVSTAWFIPWPPQAREPAADT